MYTYSYIDAQVNLVRKNETTIGWIDGIHPETGEKCSLNSRLVKPTFRPTETSTITKEECNNIEQAYRGQYFSSDQHKFNK